MDNTRTMTLCRTCTNSKKVGRGRTCELTGKTCGVPLPEIGDDCVNYGDPGKANYDISTGIEIN